MSLQNKLTKNVFFCYFPIVVIFATIRMLLYFGVLDFLGSTGSLILSILIQVGLLFSVSVFLFALLQKLKLKDTFKFFGFNGLSWKAILIAIFMGVVIFFLNVFISSFFNGYLLPLFGYKSSSGSLPEEYPVWLLIVRLITTALLPAICEETVHRGLLLKGLSPMGRKWAILISSVLFGLLHINIEQFFYATILGFVFGYVSIVCESIYPAMIMHFMNNALSVFMSFSKVNNLGADYIFSWIDNNLANNYAIAFIFIVLFIILLIILFRLLLSYLFKNTTIKRMAKLQDVLIKEIAKETYLQELEDVANGEEKEKPKSIPFELFDKIYKNKTVDIGQQTKFENMISFSDEKYKMDMVTKTLMIASFVLLGVLTLLSFIGGLL